MPMWKKHLPKKPEEKTVPNLALLKRSELIRYARRWQKYGTELEAGIAQLGKASSQLINGFEQACIYLRDQLEDEREKTARERADRLEWQTLARELMEERC